MYSLNDSDSTYCSEVEELLKATSVLEKPYQNVVLRRSQRLSQKPKVKEGFSWKNVHILKNGLFFKAKKRSENFAKNPPSSSKKCTQDIFNSQVLGEEEVAKNYIPLDLSNKSKLVTKQTSTGELDDFNAQHYLKRGKTRNVAEKAEETTEDNNIKQNRKRERPKKVHSEKIWPLDTTKCIKLNSAVVKPYKSKTISFDHLSQKENFNVDLLNNRNFQIEPNKTIILDESKGNINSLLEKTNELKSKIDVVTACFSKKRPKKELSKILNCSDTIKGNLTSIESLNNEFGLKTKLQTSCTSNTKTKPRKTSSGSCNCSSDKPNMLLGTNKKLCNKCSYAKMELSKTSTSDKSVENLKPTKKSDMIEAITKDLPSKSLKRSCGTLISNKNIQIEHKNIRSVQPHQKSLPLKSFKRSGTLVSNKSIQLQNENSNLVSKQKVKLLNENNATKNISKDLQSKAKTTKCKLNNSPDIFKKLSNEFSKDFPKQTDLKNQNLNTTSETKCNKSSKRTSNVFGNKSSEDSRNKKETAKTKLDASQDIFEKFSNDTQTLKRSQKPLLSDKRRTNLIENASNIETQTNVLQNLNLHIKSEQLTLLETFSKTFEEINPLEAIQKSLTKSNKQTDCTKNLVTMETAICNQQNNSSQIQSEKCSSCSLKSDEKNSSKKTQITNKNNKILEKNFEKTHNVTNNFKSKVSAQKSFDKRISQYTYFTRSSNTLLNENTQKLETNELKIQTQSINSNTQSVTENSTLNKNYLKSFDKTLFVDKINTTTNHNAYEKPLPANIPPTPADSTQELCKKSLLPLSYPSHFKYQLPPEAVLTRSSNEQFHPLNVITPDDTPAYELLESSSSSPSLPESLCKLFENKNIKDILNVDRVSYRLYDYHVQALALMLNLNLEYLHKILDKIMNFKPNVLKNIDKAVKMPFVPDHDLFTATPEESWASGEVVFNSQNSKKRRISVIGERIEY
ncbi:uncharacterized protein DDB_G0286591-like [Lucilia sericata]|uniref:uncharacterized protein DDB_G0286591-like n=1 Tax=Lucilia sericata TaxID=13632 RepID=UPI0018A8573A|nr:uncharacterized protein DDB_G0286591-like [Lucilia sericata]